MKFSNELKVGLAIILATAAFILGVRYFEDLPLFSGTYDLETEFGNAAGLIPGNIVRVNGVTVGSIDEVTINPENNNVKVFFHVDGDIAVREGSQTLVSGFDALGVVRMDLLLGPPGGATIPDGGFVPSKNVPDILADLTERAPMMVEQVDSVLVALNGMLQASRTLVEDPESEIFQTLSSVQGTVGTLNSMLRSERERLSNVLASVDTLTANLASVTGPGGDSLKTALSNASAVMERLDGTLASLDSTAVGLNTLLAKVNSGEGTLGLLVNDPGLYHRTDSLLQSIDALLLDFKTNPGKYLKEMRIVDLF